MTKYRIISDCGVYFLQYRTWYRKWKYVRMIPIPQDYPEMYTYGVILGELDRYICNFSLGKMPEEIGKGMSFRDFVKKYPKISDWHFVLHDHWIKYYKKIEDYEKALKPFVKEYLS